MNKDSANDKKLNKMNTPRLDEAINRLNSMLRNDELSELGKDTLAEYKAIKEHLALFSVSHSLPAEVEGILHNIRFDETDNLKEDAEYLWSRYCG